MKKSYFLLEIVLTISLIAFLYTLFIPKNKINNLEELTNKISLYLSYTRFKAFINDKFDSEDNLWHKKRWTIKFFRCRETEDGIYYSIYSDNNKSGHPSAEDSLKDPLTKKNIYSSNYCKENNSNSKYVLLTKSFGITDVNISCNETTSLGQLSFGSDGKVYSKLSNYENESSEYEIKEHCSIKFFTKDGKNKEIIISPETSYSKIKTN
ncbi:MAG: type II secretion system protein [Aliarcobacter sp.]|nr:type II secretion system protein [Aliarcobacter sp.]